MHSVKHLQEVLGDPKTVDQIRTNLAGYEQLLDKLDKLIQQKDPVALIAAREIGCFVCDLCSLLEVDYDPALGQLLLQYVGGMMQNNASDWEGYTRDIAPRCNARRSRTSKARDST